MAETVYVLCAITAALCAVLLLRSYFRNRTVLLLWTSLCFVGLFVNNTLLVVDLVIFSERYDLSLVRSASAAAAGMVLLFGLIWEAQ